MADIWRPTASIETQQVRANTLRQIRTFFEQRRVLEVETPCLSTATATDPNIESFSLSAESEKRYLHTSPEFPMKRLLASGSGDIYQICRVFRVGESGRFHNPEFTLLEWYRTGFDHQKLMQEVESLLCELLSVTVVLKPADYLSYQQAFEIHAGFNPHAVTVQECVQYALNNGIEVQGQMNLNDWLDLFMSRIVAPAFLNDRLTFIHDYPADQASLARIRDGSPPVAERFEVFMGEMELGNGFHELSDATEQRERFTQENAIRRKLAQSEVNIDKHLLQAMEHGLPDCAGVALGVDRIVMLATGAQHIKDVIAFPWSRA